ncbi:hypothetical protein RI367_003115 [Sorochytrium milnesiophthora]
MSGNNIKVVCRFRPQNKREIAEGGVPIIDVDAAGESVQLDGKEFNGSFTFDKVFNSDTSQSNIFNYAVKDIVDEVSKGYNGTVFAYGQTGSGKTFTMMGADIDNSDLKGVIPRITERIFESIVEAPSNLEFTVKVSYMEIYMEKIKDLLNPANDNLPIHEEKSRGVYVKGLLEVYVSSVDEVYEVMRRGGAARVVAHTNMNAESSRSHSIFVITMNQKNMVDGSNRSGKLSLVDLAGSEKVGKTGASGQTLEEAKMINRSLTALGMVINALTDGKSTHVPYRDSKLTRILQESLGGNSRTTLIINCSPSSFNEAETLGTLRFGMRAKSIKNKAKINQDLSPAQLKALLKKVEAQSITFKDYIAALEGEVSIWRSGSSVSPEQYITYDKFVSGGVARPIAPAASSAAPAAASAHAKSSADGGASPRLGGDAASPPAIASPIPRIKLDSDPTARSASPALAEDEREEFLRRENELTDDLAKKASTLESMLEQQRKVTQTMSDELELLKKREADIFEENKELTYSLHEIKLQLEKVTFDSREAQITVEDMRERNVSLESQIDELKKQLSDAETARKSSEEGDREKRRQEKMAAMMAELDPTGAMTEKERAVRQSLHNLLHDGLSPKSGSSDNINGRIGSMELMSPTATSHSAQQMLEELSASKRQLEQADRSLKNLQSENEQLSRKKADLEQRLTALELDFEELLDKSIQEEEQRLNKTDGAEHLAELKNKLEAQYSAKRDAYLQEVETLKAELQSKNEEITATTSACDALKTQNDELQQNLNAAKDEAASLLHRLTQSDRPESEKDKDLDMIKKTMAQQLAEFDIMKKALMKDLQNRCEKVVELELSLDDIRIQYNNMLKNNNMKATQKKMSFLERNLEQLTSVQKQLVEQNATLKKDIGIAERKLATRNERIQTLEDMVSETQGKLASQKMAFEAQLKELRQRLRDANNGQSAGNDSWTWGRVAKPLRGGGAGNVSVVDDLEAPMDDDAYNTRPRVMGPRSLEQDGKRSSWLNFMGKR